MKRAVVMTEGKPLPLLVSFALPMMLGNVFQLFYSMVDAIVVGKFVSANALAAIGATNAILHLMISLIIGFTVGTGIVTAQTAGAGDTQGLRRIFSTSAYVAITAAAFIAVVGCLLAMPALRLLGTPADIIDDARTYLIFHFATCVGPVVYNLAASFLRSQGDSKTPLMALIISSVTNIALDLLLVLAFDMGVAGVAFATAIAQILSALFCLWRIRRNFPETIPEKGNWKFHKSVLKSVLKFGIPMSVQNILVSFGMMAIQGVINDQGTIVVAGYTAASKVEQIALQLMMSVGSAASTFAGQNYGAKLYSRIFDGMKAAGTMVVVMSLAVTAVILPFGKYLVMLFLDSDAADIIAVATTYLSTVSVFYLLCGIMNIYGNTLRGLGFVTVPTAVSFVELGVKTLAVFLLAAAVGHNGIWFAWPISWAAACACLIVYFHLIAAKKLKAMMKS